MSRITLAYMRTRDIDWFAVINNQPCHFASNGGILPNVMQNRERLVGLQHEVALLKNLPNAEIQINRSYVERRFAMNDNRDDFQQMAQDYIRSFVDFAKKGLTSYDRLNPDDPNDNRYIWIAKCSSILEDRHISELLHHLDVPYVQNMNGIVDFGELDVIEF